MMNKTNFLKPRQKTVNSQAWIHHLMVNNYLTRTLLCNIQNQKKIGSQVYNQIHCWNLAYLWLSYSFLSWLRLKYQIFTTFLLLFSISFVLLSCICLVSWTPQIPVFCSPVWTPQRIQQMDEWFNPSQTRQVNWLPEIYLPAWKNIFHFRATRTKLYIKTGKTKRYSWFEEKYLSMADISGY